MTDPSYLRVVRGIRAQIADGRFAGDVPLPTEAVLAKEYGVSRHTIRRAFQDLVADELVHRTRGRGTFAVSPGELYVKQHGSIDDLMALSEDTQMEILTPPTREVDVAAAGRLGLRTDVVTRLDLVRNHGGSRFCFTRIWLPEPVASLLADVPELAAGARSAATVIGLLDVRLRDPIAQAHQSVTAEGAPGHVSEALHCELGHPTLRADRVYFDRHDIALELATSHFLPELYSYRTHLRRTR